MATNAVFGSSSPAACLRGTHLFLRFLPLLQQPHLILLASRPISAAPAAAALSSPSSNQKRVANSDQRRHRLAVFQAEQERQRSEQAASAPSIEVTAPSNAQSNSDSRKVRLKQGVSTPMDAARELLGSEGAARECALALVNGTALWDMHRPLVQSCTLKFVTFMPSPTTKEDSAYSKAFSAALWRSGAMLLGSVFETAFKADYNVKLISSPPPFFPSGSFIYDCQVTKNVKEHMLLKLNTGHCLDAWHPSRAELRAQTRAALPLLADDAPFEPLDVPLPVAVEMFKHNNFKLAAAKRAAVNSPVAPEDSQQRPATVTVYRVGDFVDLLGRGPMLSRTGQIGHLLVTAVHHIVSPDYGSLARVQGAALAAAAAAASPGSVADWIAAALKRAAVPNSTLPPTIQQPPAAVAAASKSGAAPAPAGMSLLGSIIPGIAPASPA